jgi:hypothetical protein
METNGDTMSTHTPGPWSITHVGHSQPLPCDFRVHTESGATRDEWEANAALIAAAPDMLAALREIETICNESVGDCRKRMGTRAGNSLVTARAAIAKATGTGGTVTSGD